MIAAWRALEPRQPALARTGCAMVAVLLACLVAMSLDEREIRGVSVWVKPAKFAASLALWCWSLALAWPALSPGWRRGRIAGLVVAGTIGCGGFEVGWITLRAALGEPSHFAPRASRRCCCACARRRSARWSRRGAIGRCPPCSARAWRWASSSPGWAGP